jgi:hypothetical protein
MAVSMTTPNGAILEDDETVKHAKGSLPALLANWRWMKDVAAQTSEAADADVVDFATAKLSLLEDQIMAVKTRTIEDLAIKIIVAHSDGNGMADGPFCDLLMAEVNALIGGEA